MSNTPHSNIHRGRSAWEQLMAQYAASGITQRQFCKQHNLSYGTFCTWRKRLRSSALANEQTAALVELPLQAAELDSAWRVELDLGQGVVLRMK